tara:strand:- start:1358 stop:1600 length:243 start_codon:yes stop_codon:yes gene_type:complete
MAENGNVYSDKQLALMDDCLKDIGENYMRMYFTALDLEFPVDDRVEMNIMNDQMLMDDPQIGRAMEQLIGVATQEEICLD